MEVKNAESSKLEERLTKRRPPPLKTLEPGMDSDKEEEDTEVIKLIFTLVTYFGGYVR